MKKIALIGYYGFNNAGDEAILYSILRSIKQRAPQAQVTVLSNHPDKTQRRYQVDSKSRWKWLDILRTLLSCDLLVFGGGSLLQDVTSKRSLDYYLGLVRLARFFRKPVYFMAQGVGPFKLSSSKSKIEKLINKVDLVSLRDPESKQTLLDMGVTQTRLELTADMVFSLYRNEIERSFGAKVLERNQIDTIEKKTIGFSVRQWKDLSHYKKKLAQVADALVEKGYQVLFLPFHFPDDVACARDVAKLMTQEPILLKEECSTLEMLGILSTLEVFVSMRMHGIVMASVMGVATVGISYDPKIEAVLELTGQVSGGRVENIDADKMIYDIQQLSLDQADHREQILETVDKLRPRARKNMDLLMSLLEEKDHG